MTIIKFNIITLYKMSEEVKSVHREPHPFVGISHIQHFSGRTVAFVGKVDRVEEGTLFMKTADGK